MSFTIDRHRHCVGGWTNPRFLVAEIYKQAEPGLLSREMGASQPLPTIVKITHGKSHGAREESWVTRFLTGNNSPNDYAGNIPIDDYAGFNLLVADQDNLCYRSNRGDEPKKHGCRDLRSQQCITRFALVEIGANQNILRKHNL